MENRKLMDEVYKKNGTSPEKIELIESTPETDVRNYRRFKEIVKFMNPPDFKADFNDFNQKKWGPWFDGFGSGFRFMHSFCTVAGSDPGLGSLTSFASESLSDEAAQKFLPIFHDMIHPKEV